MLHVRKWKIAQGKSCNMCNFYVPFHLSLNAGHLLLALKKDDFSSPKLWSTVAASGNDGATAFVYSVLSHHNQTGFQWELLKRKALKTPVVGTSDVVIHLLNTLTAMSCSLCTKGKYSRSCWKAPLMHQSWVNLDSGNTTKEQTADSLLELENEKNEIISIPPPFPAPRKIMLLAKKEQDFLPKREKYLPVGGNWR